MEKYGEKKNCRSILCEMYLYKIEISICPTPPYNKALIYKEKYIKVVIVGKTHIITEKHGVNVKTTFQKACYGNQDLKGFTFLRCMKRVSKRLNKAKTKVCAE